MKKKKLTEEAIQKRKDRAFKKKISNVFINAGFHFLKTMDKHVEIGNRKVEVDSVFFYENILLVCEDTGAIANITDHIRSKKEAFDEIKNNFSEFFEKLCTFFPEAEAKLKKYSIEKYQIFNLYFSQTDINLTNEELSSRFSNIKFVRPESLEYFHRISQSIKLSSCYEIFRFLGLKKEQIGISSSTSEKKSIKAPIICPKSSTSINGNVRVVSFMMSAENLLSTCYVMRKDNWEDSIWLYQRLIDKDKLKKIREFLVRKGEAFYNNIIVSLPDNIRFITLAGESKKINEIGDFENCKLEIPDEMNSICVIDGQHRIFAHYEGPQGDKYEDKIMHLRPQLHLLVTGLIFPEDMPEIQRTKIQSEIFLDINSNSKPVQADVLLHIEMLRNPFSDIGLARQIIEKLNKRSPFFNMFEISSINGSKIKVASIIKFALRYLVSVKPTDGRESLYKYWTGDKDAFSKEDKDAYNDYINFCTGQLSQYFSAIREVYKEFWENADSKLLSVISINGFIIAFNRQLIVNGVKDFNFYYEKIKKLEVNFDSQKFLYTSSQYKKFSDEILEYAFNIHDDTKNI